MTDPKRTGILQHLRQWFAVPPADKTDGQLLERFVEEADENAFALLVQRYGRLVLNVCRRVLRDHHAADDAFQATFLVLARRATSIRRRESLVSWLYGVALRTALKARARTERQRRQERQVVPVVPFDPCAEADWRDLGPVLDEEVQRLPPRYREAFVLCHLHGQTNEEAARALGWPTGTVKGRLAEARELLRKRLSRRGVMLGAGGLALVLSEKGTAALVPAALGDAAVKAAMAFAAAALTGGAISTPVAALAEGVLHDMFTTKFKTIVLVLLALLLVGTGAGVFSYRAWADKSPQADLAPQSPGLGEKKVDAVPPVRAAMQVWPIVAGDGAEMSFSADGKYLATVREGKVTVWEAARGTKLKTLEGLPTPPDDPTKVRVRCAVPVFSPDGSFLAVLGRVTPVGRVDPDEKTCLAVWNVTTGRRIQVREYSEAPVTALAFAPDGKVLALGLADTVALHEVATGNVRCALKGLDTPVASIDIACNGRVLTARNRSGTVRVWSLGRLMRQGQPAVAEYAPAQLDALAGDLASRDAVAAYRAIWSLTASPEQAVSLLKRRLAEPGPRPALREVARLVADLDSQQFAVRQRAEDELGKLGRLAEAALRDALAARPALEVQQRLERLLGNLDLAPGHLVCLRGVETLELIGSRQAREALAALAQVESGGAVLPDQAGAALRRLAARPAAAPSDDPEDYSFQASAPPQPYKDPSLRAMQKQSSSHAPTGPVKFSPDSNYLATATEWDVGVWQVRTGKKVYNLENNDPPKTTAFTRSPSTHSSSLPMGLLWPASALSTRTVRRDRPSPRSRCGTSACGT